MVIFDNYSNLCTNVLFDKNKLSTDGIKPRLANEKFKV